MIKSIDPEKLVLKAPCKINLHLKIRDRRSDGFHDLESIFVPLDYADTLVFTPMGGDRDNGLSAVTMKAKGPFLDLSARRGQIFDPIPLEKNLVYRAAEIFRKKTSYSGDLAIEIIKRIPPGSGLGGGSSNAAAALLGLNSLADRPGASGRTLSREELLDAAAELGSDVPFFIPASAAPAAPAAGTTPAAPELAPAWVTGRGECIKPLPSPPPLGVLLVFPGFGSHTGRAFGLLDTMRGDDFSPGPAGKGLVNGTWPFPDTWKFSNDFLELFLNYGTDSEKQLYRTILEDLQQAGASFVGLSGSGSACFGIFNSFEDTLKAKRQLAEAYILESTFFLAY
jgi:4-diphosphocytidyl-2-C-methyl-D-erythritol kinase